VRAADAGSDIPWVSQAMQVHHGSSCWHIAKFPLINGNRSSPRTQSGNLCEQRRFNLIAAKTTAGRANPADRNPTEIVCHLQQILAFGSE
jgi:hypothetical protein